MPLLFLGFIFLIVFWLFWAPSFFVGRSVIILLEHLTLLIAGILYCADSCAARSNK